MEEMPFTPAKPDDARKKRFVAALSYVYILFVIPLLMAKGDKFLEHHVKQGIALFVVEVLLGLVPVIGWAADLGLAVVAFYGAFMAWSGTYWELPVLAKYAKRIRL